MAQDCTCAPDGTGGLCARCRWLLQVAHGTPGAVPPVPPMTEKAFQAQVIALAKQCGWALIYHTFLSKRSPAGFPDLACCRAGPLALRRAEARGRSTNEGPGSLAGRAGQFGAWRGKLSLVSG